MSNEISKDRPEPVEDLPLNKGSFVELYSLSREEMNGKTGEILGFDTKTNRFMVKLDDPETKTIKVKQINLRRIPLQPESVRRSALAKVEEAFNNSNVSGRILPDEGTLRAALTIDRCCPLAHFGLAEHAFRRNNRIDGMMHIHRAAAHLYPYREIITKIQRLSIQMEYSTCLGEIGDIAGEETWLKKVLQEDPNNYHALSGKVANLQSKGMWDESWEAGFRLLERPDQDPEGMYSPQQVAHFKQNARQTLVEGCGRLIFYQTTEHESAEMMERFRKALVMCNRIFDAGNLNPDDQVILLSWKGFLLAHKTLVVGQENCWDDSQTCFRDARYVRNSTALIKSMLLFWQARAYELRGDYVSESRDADYREAMSLLKESEQIHTDPATRQSYLRLQGKSNPKLISVVDPSSGNVMFANVAHEEGVDFEVLPQGPAHARPEREEGIEFVPE